MFTIKTNLTPALGQESSIRQSISLLQYKHISTAFHATFGNWRALSNTLHRL